MLIVGERGTGKTSLALAIAAEAKVPVVKVKAQQLEAGLWAGQSASNVRELFQTARDLVTLLSSYCSCLSLEGKNETNFTSGWIKNALGSWGALGIAGIFTKINSTQI